MSSSAAALLAPNDTFARRHTGDSATETAAMLALLGYPSVDALVDAAVPPHIRRGALNIPAALRNYRTARSKPLLDGKNAGLHVL